MEVPDLEKLQKLYLTAVNGIVSDTVSPVAKAYVTSENFYNSLMTEGTGIGGDSSWGLIGELS